MLLAAQSGDAEAFAALYDAHAPRLFAVCVGMLTDRQAAQELVQDTFVRAWRGLKGFRGDSSFATWLHRIAINEMLTTSRRDRRRSLRVSIEADLRNEYPETVATSDSKRDAHDIALGIDLEQAIARLPDGARAVFVLYDIGGYGHAEISAQLGIAEGTSKAHLFRARRLLRAMLDR